ncbi:MAG: DNA replication/repair protein RecF [Nocardioidaceae bacterium]
MYVSRVELVDFRSYPRLDVELPSGVVAFIGPNGQGKTNLVEAIDYTATQTSHRVASDHPLVRVGASQAIVRTTIRRGDRQALVELEINPGRSNRARLNRSALTRARDALGVLRSVVFSPDDLDLVKGDPGVRRRYLDDLLVARQPRYAGVRSDYDRVLRQRTMLLKTAGGRSSGLRNEGALSTLEVWDSQLAARGAELTAGRLELVDALSPHVAKHYTEVAQAVPRDRGGNDAGVTYRCSTELGRSCTPADIEQALLASIAARRAEELGRGVTLVGPHRDDLVLTLGELPAKGYASHGESWSLALALKLASFEVQRFDSDDPVLILDDVFAELDELRRDRLATLVAATEQVLVTAAVPDDVPAGLTDQRFDVSNTMVTRG